MIDNGIDTLLLFNSSFHYVDKNIQDYAVKFFWQLSLFLSLSLSLSLSLAISFSFFW